MQDFFYLNADEVERFTAGQEVVTVRTSTLYHLVWYGIFLLVFWSCVGVYAGYHYHEMFPAFVPSVVTDWFAGLDDEVPYIAVWVGGFMMIFVLMARAMYKKSRNERGWRVKAMAKGVFIQFRPYMNQDFNVEDETVFFIPAALISALREVRFWEKSGADEVTYKKFVEFRIKRLEREELERRLKEEGNRKSSSGSRWIMETVKLSEDGAVLVDFVNMRPGSKSFMNAMKRWYMTQPALKRSMKEARQVPSSRERLREKMSERRKNRHEKI